MPNWCSNTLHVSGAFKSLDQFERQVGGPQFSLNRCRPMPRELNYIASPSMICSSKEVKKAKKKYLITKLTEKEPGGSWEGLPITRVTEKRLIKKYGFTNWYDWRIANWGTKWDIDLSIFQKEPRSLVYSFDTAWSPPIEAILYVSRSFPSLRFSLNFSEEGMGFKGRANIRNGKMKEKRFR